MGDIFAQIAPVEEIAVADAAELNARMRDARAPFVARGLVADWPLVKAARRSGREARTYLLQRARDVPYPVAVGDPASGGRMFYDEAMRLNFRSAEAKLPDIFARIDAVEGDAIAPPLYLSSIDVRNFFPGLHEANHVPLDATDYLASIWIGTRTRVAAHNDTPNNLACVAAGKRRFTVFPRDQYANLYLGPVDNTPGGRAVSMVDFHAPDLERFPRFREALSQARTVELDAGDAIYMPGMWWHHVEGLAPFNILVNYWWRTTPAYLGNPQDALNHAMMSIRDLPDDEKAHWRDLFDFYVFGDAAAAASHIPADARGVLAPLTAETAGRIRGFLLRQLSR